MHRLALAPLALVLTLAACGGGRSESADRAGPSATPAASPVPARNGNDDRDAIEAVEQAMRDGYRARDPDAILSHYADDAILTTSDGRLTGKTAMRAELDRAFALPTMTWTFKSDHSSVSGDLAYVGGRFEGTAAANGRSQSYAGSYVTIYRRQYDGTWLVIEDMNVSDPAKR